MESPSRDAILQTVLSALKSLGSEFGNDSLLNATEETRLMGEKSGVDSMALVTIIAEIEAVLEEKHGLRLVLADERAMSQIRSPFRRVGSLVDYILELHGK